MLFSVPAAVVLSFAVFALAGTVERSETRVDIRGPVARITIKRVMSSRSLVSQPNKAHGIFDIAVPKGARNLTVNVSELSAGPNKLLREDAPTVVLPSVSTAIDASFLAPIAKVSFDPSAALRLAFDASGPSRFIAVTYSYTLSLTCRDGRWHLELPGAVDLSPISGDLFLSLRVPGPFQLSEVRIAGRSETARGQAFKGQSELPGQLAVPISFKLRDTPNSGTAGWSMMAASDDPGQPPVLAVCRAEANATVDPPSVVIVVIDTSRSVGIPGLSWQREFAKAFLSALPVSTRFNVISFAADTHRLFPFARLPTQEAFGLLDQYLVPESLANGTSLPKALSAAAREVEQEVNVEPLTNPWVLLLGDGSLPQTTTTRQTQAAATARLLSAPLASVVLRPESEDQPMEPAVRIYRDLAATGGGAFRSITPPGVTFQARSMAAELLAGGGWFDVQQVGKLVATELAPGAGKVMSLSEAPKRARGLRSIRYRHRGLAGSLPIRSISLPLSWSQGLPESTPLVMFQTKLPSGRPILVMPLSMPTRDAVAGGELERSVLRNALSLSYLPRARACYLNRSASNARMRDLQGKVRLSLELERGEMLSAKVISTTLDSPEVEKCLVDATFSLNIPRPLLRDAPVEAVLNLVFRPATTDSSEKGAADVSLLNQELEVLLGPRHVVDTAEDLGAIPGN